MEYKEIAKMVSMVYGCNCDLDSWKPEPTTGHSWVCRIHKKSLAMKNISLADMQEWVKENKRDRLIRD